MCSRPAKALTSMSRLDCGRWKLVRSAPTRRKLKPGEMKMSVAPECGRMGPAPAEREADFFLQGLHYQQLFYVYAGISLVIGVYLTYCGFKTSSHS